MTDTLRQGGTSVTYEKMLQISHCGGKQNRLLIPQSEIIKNILLNISERCDIIIYPMVERNGH